MKRVGKMLIIEKVQGQEKKTAILRMLIVVLIVMEVVIQTVFT